LPGRRSQASADGIVRYLPEVSDGRATIRRSGDLPQLEQPDETAAVVDAFLA